MHMTHPTNGHGIPRLNTDPPREFHEYPKCIKLPDGRYVDVKSLDEEEALLPPPPPAPPEETEDERELRLLEEQEAKLKAVEAEQARLQAEAEANKLKAADEAPEMALSGKPWEQKGKGKK